MSTGDTLYRLPMPSLGGAAFTSDGATLYVASGQYPNNEQILSVNAATGAVTAQGSLPAGLDANDIALDATASHLFVAVRHDDVPEVLVYDTGSLSLVGRLTGLPDAMCLYPGYDVAIAVDDGSSTVFVVNGTNSISTCIWEFDMVP
jgi:DNA-binding beta-propeller fold protein YncE